MTRRVAKGLIALILVAAVAAVYFAPLRDHLNREEIRAFVSQLRGVWYGPVAFILIFAVGCVFALPATIFVLAAGVIWGWAFGGTYSILGGILGAVASFYVGRFIGEGVLHRFGRLGEMVGKQVDHAGFKSLLLLRFVPGIPFPVLNYGAGVCGVRARDFVGATLLGMAPSIYVFSYCADALFNGTMSEGEAVRRLVIVAVLMIAIVLIPGLVKRRMAQAAQPKV
jgi:uncharacterized membrane protein YdjX (TVP38/TMEM64 family)